MRSFTHLIESGYQWLVKLASYLQSPLLLAVRLYWGYQFLQTGWGKFKNLDGVTEFFTSLSIPFPHFNAMLVATTETVGGALLILGLASRLAALPLTITLCVAYATADRESLLTAFAEDNDKFLKSSPLTFLFVTLMVLAFGPGKFSLDYVIQRFVLKKPDVPGATTA